MEWGMQNRLNKLIQKDGKALFLPIDHGYFQVQLTALKNLQKQ
jgi:DhnA family fructose-bisphosphate aldolase class Ia